MSITEDDLSMWFSENDFRYTIDQIIQIYKPLAKAFYDFDYTDECSCFMKKVLPTSNVDHTPVADASSSTPLHVDFDPTMFYENRFWNRRPDGIVISSDRNKDFLRVKQDEADEQHRSTIEVLRAAAPEWTFEQINFVAGRRGAVVEDDFYNKLEKLNVQAGKRDKIMLAHVQRICKVHDTVMQSYCHKCTKKLEVFGFWRKF